MADETSINNDSLTIHPISGSDDSQDGIKDESNKPAPLNILSSHRDIKIDEQFVLKLTKGSKNISRTVKNSCKVLHLSSEWSFEEVLAVVDGLDTKEYPQLFIFIIETTNITFNIEDEENSRNLTKLQKSLLKFGSSRPIILQVTSGDENATKIYYQDKSSYQFISINRQQDESKEMNPFSSFLVTFLDKSLSNSELEVLNAVRELENCSLVLRFLRTFNLSDGLYGTLVLDAATNGIKAEFLAALDSPFDSNGRILSYRAQRFISNVFGDDDEDTENDDSVLLRAIENENTEVIDYLITYWIHLIQQLPFDHQVKISTAALETNQHDVLCDLLDIADYPFPKDFKVDSVDHDRLLKIVAERIELHAAIEREDFEKIDELINNNLNQKFNYNPSNKSALTEAINVKKFPVFYYLKSLGFKGEKCDDILKKLTKEDKEQAVKLATEQRKKNVNKSQIIAPKSVMLLSMRSSFHNSRIEKLQIVKYRGKIIKWLEDIHKVAPELIDVAASCDELQIIFDFESENVENASLAGSNAAGSMYASSKEIFMGAKLLDSNDNMSRKRDQQIKGVLAHELCHYVMKLVYENKENPYYKIMVQIAEIFEEIVKSIDKWSGEDAENPNDECNGTISSVFKCYDIKDFHPELIVRVVHILAEFDDDEEKSKYLQDKYKILFDYWENQVIPDLRRFDLRNREAIRKMNRMLKLLGSIKNKLYFFSEPKAIKALFDNQLTVVTTNVPMLLLSDIYNYLQYTVGELFDTENIFIDPEVMKNKEHLEDFTKLLQDNPKLNILVDCSLEIPANINDFQGAKTILVVSSAAQHEELLKILNDPKTNPTKMEINYKWSDLKQESQELLIETEVSFQNWSELSLLELLMPGKSYQEPTSSDSYQKAKNQVLIEFSEIVDDNLLNLLVEDSDILIGVQQEVPDDQDNKNFEYLFTERGFINKSQIKYKQQISMSEAQSIKLAMYVNREGQAMFVPNISQDQLLFDAKDKPVVLISDIAGNGKSWVMKNFANTFRKDDSIKWVTHVDLKKFIDEFKAQEGEPEFETFMTEKILKPEQKFEAKIFQKMYKDGKVLILFDGFDEIAPDCAEFVSKLAQNFEQNGGNQLWIATRDYFEVNLQEKLKTDAVYGCVGFNMGDVVDLIAQSWILMDKKFETVEEFDIYVENPDEHYSSYLQKAHQIVQKLFINFFSFVGMPHLIKVIAESSKDDKDGVDMNISKIFDKFIDSQYKKWTFEKGQIRKAANIQSQKYELNFRQLHQFIAISNLFPEFLEIFFPGSDRSDWPVVEIIACGLCTEINGKILFLHETYGEFLVAEVIVAALNKSKNEKVIEIFVKILTNQKYVVIRGFINGLIDDLTLDKIQPKLKNFVNIFDENSNYKFENFYNEVFMNNLVKFANFTIKIFKCENYERKRKIIQKHSSTVVANLNDIKSLATYQKFIFDTLNDNDFKYLIIECGIIPAFLRSSLELDTFEMFLTKAEEKSNKNTIKKGLMSRGSFGFGNGNILHHLSQSLKFNLPRYKKLLQICQKYLNFNEICGLLMQCNEEKHNILILCVISPSYRSLKEFWRETERFYSAHGSSEEFKELVKQEDSNESAILNYTTLNSEVKLHKDFWEVLLNTFDNREELKDIILKIEYDNVGYIHKFIVNANTASIESVFKILKQNFTNQQFTEIINSKGLFNMNLLQTAAMVLKVLDSYRFVWKFFRESCNSDAEFLESLKEVDTIGKNILHYCSYTSTREIFEFVIDELEILATRSEIRKMLSRSDINGHSVLQCSALQNIAPELFESVWKVMRKYFDTSEIVNFIKNEGKKYRENLLLLAFMGYNLQMLELIWNEIKKLLSHDELIGYLQSMNNASKDLFEKMKSVKTGANKIGKDKVEWITSLFNGYNIKISEQLDFLLSN